MLDYPAHAALREYVASLNRFYLSEPSLWEQDFRPQGFAWIYADAAKENMVAFRRIALNGDELIVVLTFSGNEQTFRLPAAQDKQYEIVFETDGNGEEKPPIRPYLVTVTVEREVTEKPKKRRKGKHGAVADAKEELPVVKTVRESHEEWYIDVPLAHMSGIVLRVANGDKNKIFL